MYIIYGNLLGEEQNCGCLQNEDLRPKTQKRRPKNED